ncbi:aminoglycoside phosphotransferase [Robertmurraya massiliosenegalensis]|uniref:aminoglycoside phosphotransferase n=1 Tax=Robertmurraya TaxID=2837507 RepID=UPI0039A518C8
MECLDLQTKVMKVTINDHGGDGLYMDRLLFYLKSQLPLQVKSIKPIRNHVFLLETDSSKYVVKGYSSYRRLKTQMNITEDLMKNGFTHTYSFLDLTNGSPLFFEQSFYGIIEYLQPSENVFTFAVPHNRVEGLTLLHEYHEISKMLVQKYESKLKKQHLLHKWRGRTATFLNNISFIKFFLQKEIIEDILRWTDWSLNGLEQEYSIKDSNVILHGDLAHHNFLRTKGEELHLIDFDLISIGETSLDYLQYANRILPYIHWSFDNLSELEKIQPFLDSKLFLYGLAFPTDIFREWNRVIREKQYNNPVIMRQLLDLTAGQFYERQRFVKELQDALEVLSKK